MDKEPLIIFHHPCSDGFTAAWVAWEHFDHVCELYGTNYGEGLPADDILADRDVYVLDFSYSERDLFAMLDKCKSLTVLDHHKTAQAELSEVAGTTFEQIPHCLHVEFDMERSGAMLTWDHFNPGVEPPTLVEYVQDRDLWRFQLDLSEVVSAYIGTILKSMQTWQQLAERLDRDFTACVNEGLAVKRNDERTIERILGNRHRLNLGGFDVPAVNSPVLQSELGHRMVEGTQEPFSAVWYQDAAGQFRFSLRSTDEGEDASAVAQLYGGGGHRNACGFTVSSMDPFRP